MTDTIRPPESMAKSPLAAEIWNVVVPAAQASERFDFEERRDCYLMQYEMFCFFAARGLEAVRAGADFVHISMLRDWARNDLLIEDATMRELFGDKW